MPGNGEGIRTARTIGVVSVVKLLQVKSPNIVSIAFTT